MYRLKQAGITSNLELKKHMEKNCYRPVYFIEGMWKHDTNNTIFTLLVDNFCVKYTPEVNAEHFLNALRKKYSITVDRKAEHIGILLKCDYTQHTIKVSILEYFKQALHKFQRTLPATP